jgi:hypothetical protein
MPLEYTGRLFRRVELYLWQDPRFRAFHDDTKLIWLHLLTSPAHGRIRCEGLLMECTYVDVARYMGWANGDVDQYASAVERVQGAFQTLAAMGWIEIDLRAEVVLLPQAVKHNPPSNPNVLTQWLNALGSVPPSLLRVHWVRTAAEAVRHRYGKGDARVKVLTTIQQSLKHHARDIATQDSAQRETSGIYVGYQPGDDDHVKEALATWRSGPPKQERPKRTRKAVEKQETVPEHFNKRQRDLWDKFCTVKFRVPGKGEQTVWENVPDPVRLCENLGGDGFPAVPLILVDRLAAWSSESPKAKQKLNQFLLNNFRSVQERGGVLKGAELSNAKPRASAQRPLDERI